MPEPDNHRLRLAILEVVNNQLRDNDPPETRQALERLLHQGYSEAEAMKLIGYVVAHEVFDVIRQKRQYDADRFCAALDALPSLPWDQETD